jgi:hypothetical protein
MGGKCSPCNDLSVFRFGTPEPVTPRGRFPRVTNQPNEMLFRAGDDGALQSLYVTSNFGAGGSEQEFRSPINLATESSSGALQVSMGQSDTPNFFFDRSSGGVTGTRQLYFARRISGLIFAGRDGGPAADPLPTPFNSLAGSNYSIAIAPAAGRAWWMSTRTSSAGELLTASLTDPNPNPVPVNVTLGGTSCPRSGLDSTPWAAPDGRFLLLSALEVNSGCTAPGSARDLYIVVTQPTTGLADASFALQDINHAGIDDADPSMSADLCWLYFASNPSGNANGFRLYRALRN